MKFENIRFSHSEHELFTGGDIWTYKDHHHFLYGISKFIHILISLVKVYTR